MKTYDLYLDSGPRMQKTMVQVPELLGCVARGDTSEAAIANAPGAIRTFLAFLARHGDAKSTNAPFTTRVVLHRTDGGFPGNGVGFLPVDERPLTTRDSTALMLRLSFIHDDLGAMVESVPAKKLDAKPPTGRPIRDILRHMCCEGAYLRGVTGSSRIQRLVDKGELEPIEALGQLFALEQERLRTMTKEERTSVILRGQSSWSARSALRRMLEHGWEHYTEIAARLGQTP